MVSAIILSYNRADEVLKTIQKLREYSLSLIYELEIVVVDNASSDRTSELISDLYPEVKLVTKKINNGIAGWNDGFKVAKYKYMLVLDDDSHIHTGLAEAVDYLEEHPNVGILALQITDENEQTDIYLSPLDAWKNDQQLVGFIGCGAIIRKEVYEKIGGFANWIYLYTHEFEYGIRCLDAGYQIRFFGKGIVIHRQSKINRLPKNTRIYGTRNELQIINKYFTVGKTKYAVRTLFNNLKFIKREGLKSGFYILTGVFQYLKLRKTIEHTPVSIGVQKFYAENFWSTKPVFENVKKRFL